MMAMPVRRPMRLVLPMPMPMPMPMPVIGVMVGVGVVGGPATFMLMLMPAVAMLTVARRQRAHERMVRRPGLARNASL